MFVVLIKFLCLTFLPSVESCSSSASLSTSFVIPKFINISRKNHAAQNTCCRYLDTCLHKTKIVWSRRREVKCLEYSKSGKSVLYFYFAAPASPGCAVSGSLVMSSLPRWQNISTSHNFLEQNVPLRRIRVNLLNYAKKWWGGFKNLSPSLNLFLYRVSNGKNHGHQQKEDSEDWKVTMFARQLKKNLVLRMFLMNFSLKE